MRRKLPWPFIIVILSSFSLGAAWGWKLIRDRAAEEGRLDAEAKIRILAPPGIFTREILIAFQRRERIEVELTTETFPASLLRRALKSTPGQYDLILLYHHQVSALRVERKLMSLYDSRVKFPTSIAPDFRKLPNDRNLMDTAPLLWGVIGLASKKEIGKESEKESAKPKAAFWPTFLIGLEDLSVTPAAFVSKQHALLSEFFGLEALMKRGPGGFSDPVDSPLLISHGSLAFSPLKELNLQFEPLRTATAEFYPMWILTAVAMADGDLERSRKFVRFLFEPAQNVALVQASRVGATTLREQEGLETIPAILQAAHFRTFPIDKISLERDERIRLADEVLEQTLLGAAIKVVKVPESAKAIREPVAAPARKPKPIAKPTVEPGEEASEDAALGVGQKDEPKEEIGADRAAEPAKTPTGPSESTPLDD
jgi:hypothetical protein